jgi:CRISPR-associated Csx2 family protein
MEHTLVSFLGRSRSAAGTGYRTATYRFADGQEHTTPFFGLALKTVLGPDRLVLLGTSGSMWDVLIEHLATEGADEDLRLQLIEAVTDETVTQALLQRVTPLAERALGLPCHLQLISYARSDTEQRTLLADLAQSVPHGRVTLDLTHSFRHLAALGLLSAFFLERTAGLRISGLYYGALEMSREGVAPVLQLDGLVAIQRWVDALDRFDQSRDYGVFAELLIADGVPRSQAECLKTAAFHERTFNLSAARRRLQTFLPLLGKPLPGAGALFQHRLAERFAWARSDDLFQNQRALAYYYLQAGDLVRAAIFGYEAVVTRECAGQGLDPNDYYRGRLPAREALDDAAWTSTEVEAFVMLKRLRNALAHGTPPPTERHRQIVASPERLPKELRRALDGLLG